MISAVGELEQQVLSSLLALKTRLQSLMEGQFADVKAPVLGPAAAQMVKVMGRYRYHLTIRAKDCARWRRLISGVLRYGMPIEKTVSLIESLHLDSESINTWKTGVCRALKQYIVDGTKSKGKCPSCGQENMAYQNGCLTCMSCGYSKCG